MISLSGVIDTIFEMDREQIVFLAGVTLCALSFGAFIFWGPNPRPRRRGALIGLQNLGLTCYLNTLLQALASCPIFVEWLEATQDQGPVASSLYFILRVLSSERGLVSGAEDPLAPLALISALQQHGWSISHGEQDAHELFHLIMVTLEEEAHKSVMADKGLSEALEPEQRRNSLPAAIGDVSGNLSDSNHVVNLPSGDSDSASQTQSLPPQIRLVNKQGEVIRRKVVPKYKYDCNHNYLPSPFCGLLTSQLQCVKCGFKSVVRYDKFDSLSLHLGSTAGARHTLTQLLDQFTHTEAVPGVACDGCNEGRDTADPPLTATSHKTLTVGKLPRCLCIHIHRMSMGSNGTPYKRGDYVDFSEFLIMNPYTHNAMIKEQKVKEEAISTEDESDASTSKIFPCRTESCSHLYRLKAVVVHCGAGDSGHFVTYRRGPLYSNTRHRSDRWYFTSDETVRDATLAEAMQASAYMLFYEKCTMTPT